MEQREKLIELLKEHNKVCGDCEFSYCSDSHYEECFADHLIANGVVVLPCRCGECEYAMTSKRIEKEKVACLYMIYPHDKNCFCYHGKRKGGEE